MFIHSQVPYIVIQYGVVYSIDTTRRLKNNLKYIVHRRDVFIFSITNTLDATVLFFHAYGKEKLYSCYVFVGGYILRKYHLTWIIANSNPSGSALQY